MPVILTCGLLGSAILMLFISFFLLQLMVNCLLLYFIAFSAIVITVAAVMRVIMDSIMAVSNLAVDI